MVTIKDRFLGLYLHLLRYLAPFWTLSLFSIGTRFQLGRLLPADGARDILLVVILVLFSCFLVFFWFFLKFKYLLNSGVSFEFYRDSFN